ncbi:MAG: flagellar motor switch protein FliN [Solirubrobacteraceae bacterium]|nr:flagellar motor switch protein FliN [Solirubrobacteraceae bacterium]
MPQPIAETLRHAAEAALANVPIADALTVGEPLDSAVATGFAGAAVTARFNGVQSGEILVAVEQEVADALQNSPLGALDISAALAPALSAAASTLGNVVTGPGQALEPKPALDALLGKAGALVVPLVHEGAIRGLVGLWLAPQAAGSDEPSAPDYPSADDMVRPPARAPRSANFGLEMLRDVAMEVTAQIGSTRMTVSELLNLADGAVIELDRSAGAPADLLVNGHLIARGEVVVIDENFGLRITEIVSDEAAVA